LDRTAIYATPKVVKDVDECYFYHTVDLPGHGTVQGNWDLRAWITSYLGNVDFNGKRVLDVGAANGFLSFEMERRGAEVISFDLSRDFEWNIVPFAQYDHRAIAQDRRRIIDRLNNAYWFCHRLFSSECKVVYGSAYEIPEPIGMVDIIVYGAILLHLRDPFLALQSGARLSREAVIVVDQLRGQPVNFKAPYMQFLPDAVTVEPKDVWWDIRPETVERMIGVLGFEKVQTNCHTQLYEGNENPLYTCVGSRTMGNSSFKASR
jgi:SAM-dependent methyltransferase